HPEMPRDEVLACLEARSISYKILDEDDKMLALEIEIGEGELVSYLSRRLSMTFFIDEFYYSCEAAKDVIVGNAPKIQIPTGKKFRITAYRTRSRHKHFSLTQTVNELGAAIKGAANLSKPDIDVVLALTNKAFVGRRIYEFIRGDFDARGMDKRPFSVPISLHPRIAMAMVNLSRIGEGQTLLDPFCGTGGILMEAHRAGAKLIGSDIDPRMIEGTARNLRHFKIGATVFQSDIADVPEHVAAPVDAIVTDLPYGRASSTHKQEILALYDKAFATFAKTLKSGGRAVVGMSEEDRIKIGEKYLKLEKVYPVRVHKSLTRYFCVYVKG
ncbi:MAG: hypothetical protein CVT47_03010, partial [Thermoplasmata archaeon HGW-Thermoplasmata-2]